MDEIERNLARIREALLPPPRHNEEREEGSTELNLQSENTAGVTTSPAEVAGGAAGVPLVPAPSAYGEQQKTTADEPGPFAPNVVQQHQTGCGDLEVEREDGRTELPKIERSVWARLKGLVGLK